jgi:hypothetical protein
LEEETHSRPKTHLFLGKSTRFWTFMKGGTPLAMLGEFHFMGWFPLSMLGECHFIVWHFVSNSKGAPHLVRGNQGILHLFLRVSFDLDEVVVVKSYTMGYILGYNPNLRSHILNHILHFLMVVVPLKPIYLRYFQGEGGKIGGIKPVILGKEFNILISRFMQGVG